MLPRVGGTTKSISRIVSASGLGPPMYRRHECQRGHDDPVAYSLVLLFSLYRDVLRKFAGIGFTFRLAERSTAGEGTAAWSPCPASPGRMELQDDARIADALVAVDQIDLLGLDLPVAC